MVEVIIAVLLAVIALHLAVQVLKADERARHAEIQAMDARREAARLRSMIGISGLRPPRSERRPVQVEVIEARELRNGRA